MTNGTRRRWGVSVTHRPLFTPRKDPVPILQEAGWAPGPVWTDAENFAPTGNRSPDRPVRSHSLYRLRYPAHIYQNKMLIIFRFVAISQLIVLQLEVLASFDIALHFLTRGTPLSSVVVVSLSVSLHAVCAVLCSHTHCSVCVSAVIFYSFTRLILCFSCSSSFHPTKPSWRAIYSLK